MALAERVAGRLRLLLPDWEVSLEAAHASLYRLRLRSREGDIELATLLPGTDLAMFSKVLLLAEDLIRRYSTGGSK